MAADDLPWPELGNISRGATRGNQGQKGCLGPQDEEGRCLLQLRVQPGVLEVKLNRQASDWYRLLDQEVYQALKLTKTYWRKARRRQDYDPRADQDHMELHEWLQQLKDKVMSYTEMLMQKGDIPGPPYIMPDNVEFTFLRKFVERQTSGIPHNPRLREAGLPNMIIPSHELTGSQTPEPSEESTGLRARGHSREREFGHAFSQSPNLPTRNSLAVPMTGSSPGDINAVVDELQSSRQVLQNARASLLHAQREAREALTRYTACLDNERKAQQELLRAEEREDSLISLLLRSMSQPAHGVLGQDMMPSQRTSSAPNSHGHLSPVPYHTEPGPSGASQIRRLSGQRIPTTPWNESLVDPHLAATSQVGRHEPRNGTGSGHHLSWSQVDGMRVDSYQSTEARFPEQDLANPAHSPQLMPSDRVVNQSRKHVRSWEPSQFQGPEHEDSSILPPRKRVHQLPEGLMVNNMGTPLQDIPLPAQGVLPTSAPPPFDG